MSSLHTTGPRNGRWRLLHLVSTFAIKTDTKWLLQIARHLDREAFDLSAACFYEGGPVRDELESLGVTTYNLDMPGEQDPRAVLGIRRLLKETNCDLVHTHLLRADLFGGAAARWSGMSVNVSTAYAIGAFRRAKRRKTDRLLDVATAWLPTHTIAVSEAVKRDCVERLRMNADRVTVIHTGIDPPPERDAAAAESLRRAWGVSPGEPLIVTVARLSYEKGIDTLIDAAAILRETHPGARVVVAGDGPDQGELEERIRRRGVSDMVRLAGFHADVWPVFWAADVVCMPSKSEGMPNVLLEAMAAGCPVVATNVGGVPEAISSGENGLLVEPENAAALASALASLIDDAPMAQRLAREARRTVEQRFLARDVVGRYAALYERLLVQRSKAHAGIAAAI
ncbi:MAG: glycosyltransferase [Planctomycetota bacterium]